MINLDPTQPHFPSRLFYGTPCFLNWLQNIRHQSRSGMIAGWYSARFHTIGREWRYFDSKMNTIPYLMFLDLNLNPFLWLLHRMTHGDMCINRPNFTDRFFFKFWGQIGKKGKCGLSYRKYGLFPTDVCLSLKLKAKIKKASASSLNKCLLMSHYLSFCQSAYLQAFFIDRLCLKQQLDIGETWMNVQWIEPK